MRTAKLGTVMALILSAWSARGDEEIALKSWAAPPYWTPPAAAAEPERGRDAHAIVSPLAVPTSPLAFVAVAPCRVADTRPAGGFTGAYGPPALGSNLPRSFPIAGAVCGIPATAQALSLNVTVTNAQGAGDIRIYPQGSAAPTVSTLNYLAGQTIANAAVVATGTAGGVTLVADVSGTDVLIDTNGYYAPLSAVTSISGYSGNLDFQGGGSVDILHTGLTFTFQGATAGPGLKLSTGSGKQFSADFAGTGSAATVARSDHNHDTAYVRKAGDSMSGGLKVSVAPATPALTALGSMSGNFASPVAYIENSNTVGSTAPALRVAGFGNSVDGVLNISTYGTGKILALGNSDVGEVARIDAPGHFTTAGNISAGGNLAARNLPGVGFSQMHDNTGTNLGQGSSVTLDDVLMKSLSPGFVVLSATVLVRHMSGAAGKFTFCEDLILKNAGTGVELSRTTVYKTVVGTDASGQYPMALNWVVQVPAGDLKVQTTLVNCSDMFESRFFDHNLTAIYLPKGY